MIALVTTDSASATKTETNTGLTASGTLTITDADLSDTVATTVTGITHTGPTGGLADAQLQAMLSVAPASGLAANPGDTHNLTWTFNSGTQAFDFLAATETLTLTYRLQVGDGHGGTTTQNVVVTINGTNDAPVISLVATDSASANRNEGNAGLTASGTLTITDADLTDTVATSITGLSHTGPTGGLTDAQLQAMLSVAPASGLAANPSDTHNLTWTFNSGMQAFDFLSVGDTLTLIYTVTTNDGHPGGTATQAVTLTIHGTNHTPSIVGETDAPTQAVMVVNPISPLVLNQGVNINSLGLATETFDSRSVGSSSNNGAGHGNFHSEVLDATFTASGNAEIVNGSSSVTSAPFFGPLPGSQDTTNYLSIGAGGTVTIVFASEKNAFGLYWGSLDFLQHHQVLRWNDVGRFLYRRRYNPALSERQPGFVRFERVCGILRPAFLRQGRARHGQLKRIRDRQHFRRIRSDCA